MRGAARAALLAVILAASAAGCGYHLVGTASVLPPELKTLYVDRFQNLTSWTDMDQRLSEAVTAEWVRRRRLQLVEKRSEADVVLSGVITSIGVTPVSFDSRGRATEYQMTLTTSARLVDERGDEPKPLWEDRAFSRRISYSVDPNAVDYFDRQLEAMDQVAAEYARGLVSSVLEGF